MMSTSIQNISSNSWNTLPAEQQKKLILNIQRQNNQLTLQIDEHQKDLCQVRATVPEECRKLFEKEMEVRENYVLNAPLHPEIAPESMTDEETQRMKNLIRDRVERQIEERRSADEILKEEEKKSLENEKLREQLVQMKKAMLESIDY